MSEDDYDLRFQVINPGYTEEQDRIYDEAMSFINERVEKGQRWPAIAKEVVVADAEFKSLILDDFLKIVLAERHFQGKEGLKVIAQSMGVPMDTLVAAKSSMLAEVSDASIQASRLTPKGNGEVN